MIQILLMIRTLLQLLPLVIDAIKTVEEAFPHAQQGAAKLDLVKGVIQNAYNVGSGTTEAFQAIAPGIDAIAKGAVAIFNSTGVFSTTPPVPAPAIPATPAEAKLAFPELTGG